MNPYLIDYSTVTDFARFLGWSTFFPSFTAIWYDNSCNGIVVSKGVNDSIVSGTSM
jgi:hypothetical protein